MLSRTALILVVVATSLVASASRVLADRVRDPVMRYSIDFPGKPGKVDFADDLPDWVRSLSGWEQSDADGYYNITVAQTLPDGQVYTDPAAALRDIRGQCVGAAPVIEERPLSTPGGRGTQLLTKTSVSGPDALVIYDLVTIVAKGNKVYCVHGSYGEGKSPTKARAFVRSLKLL